MHRFQVFDQAFLPHLSAELELQVSPGEGLVITGHNGIGKSTALHALFARYHERLSLSFIEQRPLDYFYDRKLLKVRDILWQTRPALFNRELFDRLWQGLGLELKEDRQLSALSGGELQALKLCAGLGKRSQVYLLDEPFQSLDAERKSFLMSVLDQFLQEEVSLLIVEHDLSLFHSPWRAQPLVVIEGKLTGGEAWTIS